MGQKIAMVGALIWESSTWQNKQITFLNKEIVVEVRKKKKKRKEKKYIHEFILIPYEVLIPFFILVYIRINLNYVRLQIYILVGYVVYLSQGLRPRCADRVAAVRIFATNLCRSHSRSSLMRREAVFWELGSIRFSRIL